MPETDNEDSPKTSRSFSTRAERSLKEVDRMLKADPDESSPQRAATQVEQAKVFALLNLADALRESRKG